jgi:formate dehydrogenase subunit delta
MDNKDLIRMVNQIADFYQPYPNDEAVAGVAEHIKSYWEPRMRKALSQIIATGGTGLSELSLLGAKASFDK